MAETILDMLPVNTAGEELADGIDYIPLPSGYSYDTDSGDHVIDIIPSDYGPEVVVGIAPLPIADFTANTTGGLAPVEVQFSSTALYADSWMWSFGNGATAADENPSYTYTAEGSYDVSLTAGSWVAAASDSISYPSMITITETPPLPDPEWHDTAAYMTIEGFNAVYSPTGKPMYPPGIMGSPETNYGGWGEPSPLAQCIESMCATGDDVFYIHAANSWFSGFRPTVCRVYMVYMEPDHIRVVDKAGNLIGANLSVPPTETTYKDMDAYLFEIELSEQTADIDKIELRNVGPGADSGYEADIYLHVAGIEFYGSHD